MASYVRVFEHKGSSPHIVYAVKLLTNMFVSRRSSMFSKAINTSVEKPKIAHRNTFRMVELQIFKTRLNNHNRDNKWID